MKIDVEKAFTYVKNDPNWVKKYLIGAGLSIFPVLLQILKVFVPDSKTATPAELKVFALLLPIILIFAILSTICAFMTGGYLVKTANERMKNPDSMLPDWKFGEMLWIGFKSCIAVFIYIIAYIAFVLCAVLAFHALFKTTLATTIASLVVCIPVLIFLGLVLNLASVSFAVDFKFASFFNFSRMKQFLNKNIPTFLIYIALMVGVSFLAQMASGVLTITIIGIVAIPFINFYQLLVSSDFIAQFIRSGNEFDKICKIAGQEV